MEKLSKFQRIYNRDAKTSQNPLFGDTFWRFMRSSKVEKGPHIKKYGNFYLLDILPPEEYIQLCCTNFFPVTLCFKDGGFH